MFAQPLSIEDVSQQPRYGCKGPGAPAWLTAHGVIQPAHPNSAWLADGARVLRLGATEYLIEGVAAPVQMLKSARRTAGVYPILRQDTALLLSGRRPTDVLQQVCNVDFAALDSTVPPVVLTSMAGVGVIVLPEAGTPDRIYRLWCDGTYGPYLSRTLRSIAEEICQ